MDSPLSTTTTTTTTMTTTAAAAAIGEPTIEPITSAMKATTIAPVTTSRPVVFLDLARELRDMIYEHYVTIDGGYMLNPESWKLKPNPKAGDTKPNPHPFGLQLTCKVVAQEMTGLALKHNLITFKTIDTMRKRDFHFEALIDMYKTLCHELLEKLGEDEFGGQMPDSLKETLSRYWPDYVSGDLDQLFDEVYLLHKLWDTDHIARSTRFAFPRLIMQQPECAPFFSRFPGFLELDLLNQPWKIPSEEENQNALQLLAPMIKPVLGRWLPKVSQRILRFFERHLDPPNRMLYRFSAAAVAIKFLNGLKPSTRAHLRNILLDEDRESVAQPERHGVGLVQFCNENPSLRIERRVSMWRALLSQDARCPLSFHGQLGRSRRWAEADFQVAWLLPNETWMSRVENNGSWDDWMYFGAERFTDWFNDEEPLDCCCFGATFGAWAVEALNLPSCITLVFDGDSIPEHTSDIFDKFVVRFALQQAALEQSFASGRLPCPKSWTWVPAVVRKALPEDGYLSSGLAGCLFERIPRIIRDIINGSSNVRLNFAVMDSEVFEREVEHLLFERYDWEAEDWYKAWRARFGDPIPAVNPVPPLAAHWSEIFEGDMLPNSEDQAGVTMMD